MKSITHEATSETETLEIAGEIAKLAKECRVVLLSGELGAGKTTLSKGIAKHLGIADFKIKSPTYTYFREYPLEDGQKLYHIDLYRIQNQDDKLLLWELDELIADKNNILLIEWAENLPLKAPAALTVKLTYTGETSRQIRVSAHHEQKDDQ